MLVTCNSSNNVVVLYRGDYMNTATRRKLDEVVKLIQGGASEKDILNKKFNRDKSKMKKWIDKLSDEFTPKEKKMLSFEKYEVVEQSKETNIAVPVDVIDILERHDKRLKDLDQYEKRLNDLELKLECQNKGKDLGTLELLHVSDDIIRMKSVVRSIRINAELVGEFNIIAEKHLNYSKTNLWNQMLLEFIEKYK